MSASLKNTESRSPIKSNPLPQAGESLKDEFHDLLMDVMMWWSIAVMMVPVVLFEWWHYWFPKSIAPGWMTFCGAAGTVDG